MAKLAVIPGSYMQSNKLKVCESWPHWGKYIRLILILPALVRISTLLWLWPDLHYGTMYLYVLWFAAPSAPRSVRARLVSPRQSVVEVRWREPAVTNGIISQYTVLVNGIAGTGGDGGALSINRPTTFNIVCNSLSNTALPLFLPSLSYDSACIPCNQFSPCRHIEVTLVLPTLPCMILKSPTHFKWGHQTWWTEFRTMVTFLKSQLNQQCLFQAEVCLNFLWFLVASLAKGCSVWSW